MSEPRLTTLVQGGGCARKLPAETLIQVLKTIPGIPHPWVDGRPGPMDDAAVATLPGWSRSLVLTIDILTPIVDDPRAFGAIAATNAMSDVWAMGGRPELALAFVGFPTDKLSNEVLREVMAGLSDAARRAGCAIVGGHTIGDTEPKAGLAVVGSVDPARVWSHKDARAGQALVLTKPIGTGIVGQAIRAGTADPRLVEAAIAQMTTLNDRACEVGLAHGATSATDVTGFGLLGHLRHVVEASGVVAEITASAVPLLDGVRAIAAGGVAPAGSKRNLAYASAVTTFAADVDDVTRLLLADAQTSGGLLLCLPEDQAEAATRALVEGGCVHAARIGTLRASATGEAPGIHVR